MKPESFLSSMRSFDADMSACPATRKALIQMLELVEATKDQVRVLLETNKKLLDTIQILKKR
jgi:hypothetical protein